MTMRTQKYRSLFKWNMQICNGPDCGEDRMWPVLETCAEMEGDIRPATQRGGWFCGHFLGNQRKCDLIWERPERYDQMAVSHASLIMPTYPVTEDMPLPMQAWNVYRGRAIAFHWQQLGVQVVPVLQWSFDGGARRLFGGLPSGGTFAVEEELTDEFDARLAQALAMLGSELVLVHGQERAIELPTECRFFSDSRSPDAVSMLYYNQGGKPRGTTDEGARQ